MVERTEKQENLVEYLDEFVDKCLISIADGKRTEFDFYNKLYHVAFNRCDQLKMPIISKYPATLEGLTK
jgi:hypothetical protein